MVLVTAVAGGLAATAPRTASGAGNETEPVVVAARDLPAGARLHGDDVAVARLPADRVPDGAVRRLPGARGHTLAGPVRRGEPLTDRRFLGPALLAGYGREHERERERFVAAPVRIADAASARLLRPGDRVDVLAGPRERGGDAEVVAAGVRVLAVPARPGADTTAGEGAGALVVLAVPRGEATALAGAEATSRRLAVTLR